MDQWSSVESEWWHGLTLLRIQLLKGNIMSDYIKTNVMAKVFSWYYTRDTLIAAFFASLAAVICAFFQIPPWVMFIGWVAYFTKPSSLVSMLITAFCVVLGIILGIFASKSVGLLMPKFGVLSFAIVVFIVAMSVVTLRSMPIVGQPTAWFLGLICYFAIHVEPSFSTLIPIVLMVYLGASSGLLVHKIQNKRTV